MSRVRQTAYLSAARFLGMAISFLSVPYFIEWLGGKTEGVAAWGAFVFVQAMGRYAAMIDSGFSVGANRLMTRAHAVHDTHEVWRIWHTCVRAAFGIGLIGAAITLLLGVLMPVSGLKPGEHGLEIFAAAAVGYLAESVANAARTALTSRQQFGPFAALQGIAQLVGALSGLAAVYVYRHPAALFAGPIGTSATLALLAMVFVRKEARSTPGGLNRGVLGAMWSFVVKAYPNHVLSIVAGSTDRVLLEKALGSGPLGGYAIASRIPEVLSLLLQPIQDTAQPLLSRAHVEGQEKFSAETLRLVRMSLAIGVALILVPCAFGDPLLKVWLRHQYVPGLATVVIGIAAFRAIEHFNVTILLAFIAAGNPGLANPTSLFNAVTTAVLTFPAAYYFGLEGVVWMKLFIQLQALLLIAVLFKKVLIGHPPGPTLRAMGATVLIGAAMASLGLLACRLDAVQTHPLLALLLAPAWAIATFVLLARLRLTPVPGPLKRLLPFLAASDPAEGSEAHH